MVLHDYYIDRYSLAAAKSSQSPSYLSPNLTLVNSTPAASPHPELQTMIPVGQRDFTTSDADILADKPFFDYLTMPYVSSIIQAFDDDASGFVRISEVNDFCESIPQGWTLLQWYVPSIIVSRF